MSGCEQICLCKLRQKCLVMDKLFHYTLRQKCLAVDKIFHFTLRQKFLAVGKIFHYTPRQSSPAVATDWDISAWLYISICCTRSQSLSEQQFKTRGAKDASVSFTSYLICCLMDFSCFSGAQRLRRFFFGGCQQLPFHQCPEAIGVAAKLQIS